MKRFSRLFRILSDSLRVIHRLDPWKLPLMLCKTLVVSAVPFVAIVLSAEIINRLSTGGGFRETLTYALISVAVIFALTLLGDYLKKLNEVKNNHCRRLYHYSKCEKIMETDWAEMESPAITGLQAKLRAEENMGFGLPLLFTSLDTLSESIGTTVLSLVFLLPLLSGASEVPGLGVAAFLLLSAVLSAIMSGFQKRTLDNFLSKLKDDNYWTDAAVQSETMANGNTFTYKNGKDIRVYGFEDIIRRRFEENTQFLLKAAKDFATTPALAAGAVGAARGLIMGGSYIFAFMFGGGLALGTIVLLASLLYQFTLGISRGIAILATIFSVAESLQMYVQFISVPNRQYRGTLPVEKRNDNEYEIEFRNVSFQYPGTDTYALKHLTLKLNIGRRMAVVGMNGSGKTTMIKLLCRLYDPTEGEITLNGIDIRKYDYEEYIRIFSVVFQDFRLFSFPVGHNVAACAAFSTEKAMECLMKSGAAERVSAMPKGLDTPLYKDYEDDGVEISGGEAQKIAIARALYKDSPFLVLDEPTAALDPIAEFEVYSKLNEIVESKTAIFISHRLSSCRFCHDIAVFHEGELIQRGGHDELLADAGGKYYELWNAQAQYYVS